MYFNVNSEKPAPAHHNPDVLKTVVKTVHELIVPVKDGTFWDRKRNEIEKKDSNIDMPKWNPSFKGAKWCLVCPSISILAKSVNLEKKARFKSWYHHN